LSLSVDSESEETVETVETMEAMAAAEGKLGVSFPVSTDQPPEAHRVGVKDSRAHCNPSGRYEPEA
jgi:hypothetical protein